MPDHSIKDADLAEKHGDEEGGASGVGGGRQEEGDPRGHREHRGRDEVDVDVFTDRQRFHALLALRYKSL